jgi:hypothetical protein
MTDQIPVGPITPLAAVEFALQDAAKDVRILANDGRRCDYRVAHALQSILDAVHSLAELHLQAQLDARPSARSPRPLTPGVPGYACGICGSLFTSPGEPRDEHSRHGDSPWCRGCADQCHEGGGGHSCAICTPADERTAR